MIAGVHTWGWESWGPPKILPILVIVVLEPMGMNCEKIMEWVTNEYGYTTKYESHFCAILVSSAESGTLVLRALRGFTAIRANKATECPVVKIAQVVLGLAPGEKVDAAALAGSWARLFLTDSASPIQSILQQTSVIQGRDCSLREYNYCLCATDP